MNCYWCEAQSGPGGTRFAIAEASAVCVSCGAGVCRAHSVTKSNQKEIRCVHCKETSHG